ncbi:MAG: hypothetical protein GX440_06845 [Propionibacterium sp.]|nr:hypothetical protein [Propionibacterium sp.]
MSELTLELTFYGSVRMGTGYAGKGLDEVIDEFAPLSAGGLKGVLRDEARTLLPPKYDADGRFERDHPFVRAVFGDRFGQQCPWNFDVVPDAGKVSARASLQIGPDGAVVKGALLVKEEAWIGSARLDVFQRGPLSDAGMRLGASEEIKEYHLALISLAARLVDKVGQRKTRGMGWVAITSDRDAEADLDRIWPLRKEETDG